MSDQIKARFPCPSCGWQGVINPDPPLVFGDGYDPEPVEVMGCCGENIYCPKCGQEFDPSIGVPHRYCDECVSYFGDDYFGDDKPVQTLFGC